MPATALFNFIPLFRKKKIETELYATVTRSGTVLFPHQTLLFLTGSDTKSFFIKLYCDTEKRALGFMILESIKSGENTSTRVVKPLRTKEGYVKAQFSARPFFNSLTDIQHPLGRLPIKKYKAGYLLGDVYYFLVPKTKHGKTTLVDHSNLE